MISGRFTTASLPSDSVCVVAVEKSSLSTFGEFYVPDMIGCEDHEFAVGTFVEGVGQEGMTPPLWW